MMDLYTWKTPNGRKVSILLEETGVPYQVHAVDIGKGQQFAPEFLKISPNNKIPAIVDSEGPGGREIALFESGAILVYLAEKSGQFLPADPARRYETLQWLMWQVGGVGPMMGQAYHFRHGAPDPIPYAVDRFTQEVNRLFRVMDGQLSRAAFLAGDYSIADMACYPWISVWKGIGGVSLEDHPNVARWLDAVGERPAVRKGMKVPA